MNPFTLDVIRDQLKSIKELLRSSERQVSRIELDGERIEKYIDQDAEDKNDIFKKLELIEETINCEFREIKQSLKKIEEKLEIKPETVDENGWTSAGWN